MHSEWLIPDHVFITFHDRQRGKRSHSLGNYYIGGGTMKYNYARMCTLKLFVLIWFCAPNTWNVLVGDGGNDIHSYAYFTWLADCPSDH